MSHTTCRCVRAAPTVGRAPRATHRRRPQSACAVSKPYAPPPFPESWPIAQLKPQEVVDTLATSFTPPHAVSLTAFYSSELGGVTTEPGLFVVHADDHGFHRGHAVFDTVEIIEGCAYDLEAHLARFFASAEAARLELPCTRSQVRRVVLETAAAGRALDGHVRYWLAAGRGGLSLTPRACAKPSLFAMAYKTETVVSPDHEIPGCTLYTATSVFAPDAPFATIKSTNYLRNVLAQMEAEDAGFDHAIFVNRDGFVTDGSTVAVGVITKQGELVVPPADVGLASCTAARVLELVPRWLDQCPDLRDDITSVSRRPLTLAEAKTARHAFVMGSGAHLKPVARWDEAEMGAIGEPALLLTRLVELFESDRDPMKCPDDHMHVDVPFQILVGAGRSND